jgi:hypothetical protein
MANKKIIASEVDNRVAQYHIRRGVLSKADWQAHLDSLPDDADEAEQTETLFSPSYEQRHYLAQDEDEAPAAQD